MAEPISERWNQAERSPVSGPELVSMPTALPAYTEADWEERRAARQRMWEERGERLGRIVARYRREAWRVIAIVRVRTRQLGDEYPLQTIGGVAAAAFVLGVILRVGRVNRG